MTGGIRVRWACGHEAAASDNADASPICGCGETRIVRTFARAPRFIGACTGPYAVTQTMEPGVVDLAPKGPLRLKKEAEDAS